MSFGYPVKRTMSSAQLTKETVKGSSSGITSIEQSRIRSNVLISIPIKKAHFWDIDHVVIWLKKYCGTYHNEYRNLFQKHEITGRALMALTDQKLLRIGITNSAHRQEILLQILKLKLSWEKYQLDELKTTSEP